MKKIVLTLALAGFIGAATTPAVACEGGKCKMEHADKGSKGKKSKKAAAKAESCHTTTASNSNASVNAGETKSCCMKKDAVKPEATKEAKAQ